MVRGDPSQPHLHLHPRVLAESLTRLWLSLSASLTPTCSRLGAPVQIQGYCQAVGTVNLPHSFIHALTSADSADEKQTPPNPRGLQQSGSLFSAPPQPPPGATGQEQRATVSDGGGSPSSRHRVSSARWSPGPGSGDQTSVRPGETRPETWLLGAVLLLPHLPCLPKTSGLLGLEGPGYLFHTLSQMGCGCPGCQLRDHRGKGGAVR